MRKLDLVTAHLEIYISKQAETTLENVLRANWDEYKTIENFRTCSHIWYPRVRLSIVALAQNTLADEELTNLDDGNIAYAMRDNLGDIIFRIVKDDDGKDIIVIEDFFFDMSDYKLRESVYEQSNLRGQNHKTPIQECLLWMVKLGCFDQYQVESLKERGIL